MSKSAVFHSRLIAAKKQDHHCYYCGAPIWLDGLHIFASKYSLSLGQAKLLKCTAEHIIPRSQGGRNNVSNIVAACLYCNRTRHARPQAPDALTYKRLVQQRVAQGRWLLGALPEILRSHA